jgi:transposase InsO family protein
MFLKKHTAPGEPLKMRNTIDLRERNANTRKLASPLPDQRGILYRVASHRYISCIDGQDAYEQFRIEPEDVKNTLMNTPDGTIESLVMQQGDCNAVATFMNVMTDLFSPYLGKWMDVYLDDIVIYTNTLEEHVRNVKIVIDILARAQFYLAEHKLQFLPAELRLLGHIITREGIRMDPEKVDGVVAWKTPTNRDLLRGFLGSVGYLADNVEGVRIPMDILNRLTGDTVAFRWGPTEQRAFDEIKARVGAHRDHHRVSMVYGDGAKPVHLVTDGCISGIAGKISQGDNWKDSPVIAFYSAKLSAAQQNYTVTEIEMLAGLETMTRYRDLLLGVRFTWYTDHRALEFLLKQRELNPRQSRWMAKLAEFDFAIEYVPGKENVLSDALSRMYSADAPGTVRTASEYVQHDETADPVRLFGASTIVAGPEVAATMEREGRPLIEPTRILRARKPVEVVEKPKLAPRIKTVKKRAPIVAPVAPAPAAAPLPAPKVAPVRAPRARKVLEPAETGRPETSKEIAQRIKKVVLRLPREQLEGGDKERETQAPDATSEAPVSLSPHQTTPDDSPATPTLDNAPDSHQDEDASPALPSQDDLTEDPSALLDTLAPAPDTSFAEAIRGKYADDKFFKKLLETPKAFKNFTVIDQTVYITDGQRMRLCVPDCKIGSRSAREIVIAHAHSLLAHLGSRRTLGFLRDHVWWKTMVSDTETYVDSCGTCKRIKPNNQRPYGLLNPLDVPSTPWEAMGVDFIGKLPESKNRDATYDCIVVFIDLLTNMVHLVPGRTTYKARDMAELIFFEIYKRYGLPARIVSDQDHLFTSIFWGRLHELLGVKLRMSSTYHPQSDGSTERANRTVVTMLRSTIDDKHKDWVVKLPGIEFAINSARSESTGYSPFFLNLGRMPRSMIWDRPAASEYPSVRVMALKIKQAILEAHDSILAARVKQTRDANRTRRAAPFSEGDLAYVSTKNISFPKGRARKLVVKFIGPYKILKDFGNNSYRIELPDRLKQRGVRDVFHASLLRIHVPNDDRLFPGRLETQVADFVNDPGSDWAADCILTHVGSGAESILQVRWRAGDTTWVEYDRIKDLQIVADYLELQNAKTIEALRPGTGKPTEGEADPQVFLNAASFAVGGFTPLKAYAGPPNRSPTSPQDFDTSLNIASYSLRLSTMSVSTDTPASSPSTAQAVPTASAHIEIIRKVPKVYVGLRRPV